MNPDLKEIYGMIGEKVRESGGLMGYDVGVRVEDGIYIKLYIRDEESIHGSFKKPMMVVYFSAPGLLTVKFLLLDRDRYREIVQRFRVIVLEKDSYRIDFDNLEGFREFLDTL